MGVALREVLTEYKHPRTWENLAGSAAIDGNNALYQFLSIIRQPDGTPLMDSEGRITSHLSGVFFRTLRFLEKGIRPVYIFDGKPPALKQETIESRREVRREAGVQWEAALARGDPEEAYKQARASSRVTPEIIATSRQLLTLMGVPWVQAPSEGEAQAAAMATSGAVTYAVSQDYDSLLFGAPLLIRNLTISSKRRVQGRSITVQPESIRLEEVLQGLGITREQLIEAGILMGTDFNPGIRGVGPRTALKIVKKDGFADMIAEKLPDFDPAPIQQFFRSPPVTTDFTLEWQPPDQAGIEELLCREYGFAEERVRTALQKVSGPPGQKTLDRWF
jgi:flap endonuclease-1